MTYFGQSFIAFTKGSSVYYSKDYGLVLTGWDYTPAEPQIILKTVPGRDGSLDLSEALDNKVHYGTGKIKATFDYIAPDLEKWRGRTMHENIAAFASLIHGQRMFVYEPTGMLFVQPYVYTNEDFETPANYVKYGNFLNTRYDCRLSVTNAVEAVHTGHIEIEGTTEPFRLSDAYMEITDKHTTFTNTGSKDVQMYGLPGTKTLYRVDVATYIVRNITPSRTNMKCYMKTVGSSGTATLTVPYSKYPYYFRTPYADGFSAISNGIIHAGESVEIWRDASTDNTVYLEIKIGGISTI